MYRNKEKSNNNKIFIDIDENLVDIMFNFFSKMVFEKYYQVSTKGDLKNVSGKLSESIIKAGIEFFGDVFKYHMRSYLEGL